MSLFRKSLLAFCLVSLSFSLAISATAAVSKKSIAISEINSNTLGPKTTELLADMLREIVSLTDSYEVRTKEDMKLSLGQMASGSETDSSQALGKVAKQLAVDLLIAGNVELINDQYQIDLNLGLADGGYAYTIEQCSVSCPAAANLLISKVKEAGLKLLQIGNADIYATTSSNDASVHLLRGVMSLENRHFEAAARQITLAIEKASNYADAYYYRGNCYAELGLYDQALADYDKALQVNPRFADAYYQRAAVYYWNCLPDAQISSYVETFANQPEISQTQKPKTFYPFTHQYDKAIADFTKALELNPAKLSAYIYRANTYYYFRHEPEKALIDYNLATQVNPAYAEAFFNAATIYEETGKIPEALAAYKNYLHCASAPEIHLVQTTRDKLANLAKATAQAVSDTELSESTSSPETN